MAVIFCLVIYTVLVAYWLNQTAGNSERTARNPAVYCFGKRCATQEFRGGRDHCWLMMCRDNSKNSENRPRCFAIARAASLRSSDGRSSRGAAGGSCRRRRATTASRG